MPASSSFVELRVNGQAFSGFERGTIQLNMEEGANAFDVEYVADGKRPSERAIFEGDEVEVAIDAGGGKGFEVVLAGYVDTVDDSDEDDAIRLRASGRSKTADLIDCSAVNKPGRWSNVTLEKLLLDLCLPFGVDVYVDGPQGAKFPSFSTQKEETVFDAISRATIKRGLFPYCVGGDLIVAQAGQTKTRTVLARGGRVIRSGRTNSFYSRYSDYVFRAQARASDTNWGKGPNQLNHTVTDSAIKRFRPLLVQAEAHDKIDLKTRAEIERNTRAGRAERITALVDGWATDEGFAWRPNTLVRFKNDVLGVDADVIITLLRFRFGEREAREVELEMTRPEAFSLADYRVSKRGRSWT